MSIPKIIHYCWFGGNPKPALAKKCIKSWVKHCSDYEIIEWSEENFDISTCPIYVQQAYEMKKWAFVSDYARLKVTHDYGGIYLDTDVELRKNLDFLLVYQGYFGFDDASSINTGLGFGAEKGSAILREMLSEYDEIQFVLPDGSIDSTPCPSRNTAAFLRRGLLQNNSKQFVDGYLILPCECLCPMDYYTGKVNITPDTISIHYFSASWKSTKEKEQHKRNQKILNRNNFIHNITHIPNHVFKTVLGEEQYDRLKKLLKR